MSTKKSGRQTAYIVSAVVFLAVCVARLVTGGTPAFWAFAIGIAVVGIVVAIVLPRTSRRLARTTDHALARRPGAITVPAYSCAEMHAIAQAHGVSAQGLSRHGGSPLAIAVLADRFEVWVRLEETPRWTVMRNPQTQVVSARGGYGNREVNAVAVVDETGTPGFLVVPAYRPIRNMGGSDAEGLQRALAALGAPSPVAS